MQDYNLKQLDQFVKRLSWFEGAWKSLDLRIGTVEISGVEYCLILRGTFEELPPIRLSKAPADPSVGAFRASRIVLPMSKVTSFLDQLRGDKIEIGGRVIAVGRPPRHDKGFEPFSPNAEYREAGGWGGRIKGPTWISFQHQGASLGEASGGALDEEALQAQWRALDAPYKDADDVLTDYFKSPIQSPTRTHSFLHIDAKVPLSFTSATAWKDNKLTIEVEIGRGLQRDEVSVGLSLAPQAGSKKRESIVWKSSAWKKKDGRYVVSWVRDIPSATACELFLRYGGKSVAMKDLTNLSAATNNVAMNVHRFFDPGHDHYGKFIAGHGKDMADDFELAIGWLMTQCGFRTSFYGLGRNLQNEVDFIAYWESGKTILGIECTTLSQELKKKFATVFQRCKDLAAVANGWRVHPVLATSLDPDKVSPSERQSAWTDKVIVLTPKELRDLFQMAEKACTPEEAFEYLAKGGGAQQPPGTAGGVLGNSHSFLHRI